MADARMFVDMLKAMLQLDPDRRITPRQVLEHKFISMRHIARMDHKSHYGTAVCGPLKPPRYTATNPVQQNPPSLAEGRKTGQPHRTKLNDGVGTVGGHAVMREQGVQKRTKHAALGASVLRVRVEDVVLPISTAFGLPVRKFSNTGP
ncbi:unnamed protein product [Pleuronectes platessa]|uniref:Uncharacterized protein n=1 Tax=Pleuronectes platessa TaxID=8262 RepID=A0A9N7YS59_PLEPL|nr:unnamed protein product [Pleuronectes platessa]